MHSILLSTSVLGNVSKERHIPPGMPPLESTSIPIVRGSSSGSNNNHNSNGNGSRMAGVQSCNEAKKRALTTLLDSRRVKKMRRLDRKIESIKCGSSKELLREMDSIKHEWKLHLQQLSEARASELSDTRQRYIMHSEELSKERDERKRMAMAHCHKELHRLKARASLCKMDETDAQQRLHKRGNRHRDNQCSYDEMVSHICEIYHNCHSEVNVSNSKIRTRQQTKNKNALVKFKNGADLSRIRFHLKEDQIKCDLRLLLQNEVEHAQTHSTGRRLRSSMEQDEDIPENFHQSYLDRHISGITNKLGPLNDPCIDPAVCRRSTVRRSRAPRVNYQDLDEYDPTPGAQPVSGPSLYHPQIVLFSQKDADAASESFMDVNGRSVLIPLDERGNEVSVDGFTLSHGTVVRLNYMGNNITVDTMMVSIKKNQLSGTSLASGKRKRVWYKDLRVGKINVAPASAY